MNQTFKFTAMIEDAGRGGAYVTIPFNGPMEIVV